MREQPPNPVNGSLAARRKRKGLTQQELADRIGVSRPLLSGIESGRLIPRLTHVKRIAEVLEVTPRTILGDLGLL